MRKSWVVLLAAILVAAYAMPAMADISFFGTARVIPTYYSNFDFDDNHHDGVTLNEGGFTMGEHVRSELRLGWKAGGDNWKIMMIAESDVIMEKDTADRSFYGPGTKGSPASANAGSEFGIERFEANYTFSPALVLSTGWNIRAADIKTGGVLFGDDHPFIELGGKLAENLKYALTYIIVQNRQLTSGASSVRDDWRVYQLKFNADVGSGDVKFNLSPMVLFSDYRQKEAKVYYYGIEGTGQIGIFKPSFEFVYADGEFRGSLDGTDIKAYAAFGGVEAAVSKTLNPYVAVRFTSGDDNDLDNEANGFVGVTDIARFTPLMGMDGNILGEHFNGGPFYAPLYSYAPERMVGGLNYGGISGGGSGNNPGELMVAVGSKGAISDALSYKAQIFLIWFDQTDNLSAGAGKTGPVDDYAGTTFDLLLKYAFAKNFSGTFIYSAFVPGDGVKDQLATTADDTFAQLATLQLVWAY